ncbi:MAG: hypothetical protein UDG94_05420 [Peptococcaceae bacterium]|nr:hypothetical protein [Peptococcaceae bacterium]
MGGVIRDIQCGMDVARMAELGRYDKEFLAYGFSWLEDKETYYFISGDGVATYKMAAKKLMAQQWITPVTQILSRRSVPSGKDQKFNQETKVALAKKIQASHTSSLLIAMNQLNEAVADDRALSYLQVLQSQLEGTFDRDKLNYFRALLEQTRIARKITSAHYECMVRWLEKNFKQMENDIIVEEQYERTFGGFYYQTEAGSWNTYINAEPVHVYETWEKHLQEGRCVFPIFWKKYWFAAMSEGRKLRERFKNDYVQLLKDTFGEIIFQIQQLPSIVDVSLYQHCLETIANQGSADDRATLLLMGGYWDLN